MLSCDTLHFQTVHWGLTQLVFPSVRKKNEKKMECKMYYNYNPVSGKKWAEWEETCHCFYKSPHKLANRGKYVKFFISLTGLFLIHKPCLLDWSSPFPHIHSKLKFLRAYLEKEHILLHIYSTMVPPLHCLQTIKVGIIYNIEVPLNTFPANYLQQNCLFILAATNNTATFWMAFASLFQRFTERTMLSIKVNQFWSQLKLHCFLQSYQG